jgi:hypothetical protein
MLRSMGSRYKSRASWCFEDGWYHICVETPSFKSMFNGERIEENWCNENLGYYRSIINPETFGLRVYFRELEHATMFKLVFGGEFIGEDPDFE